MSKREAHSSSGYKPVEPEPARFRATARAGQGLVATTATIGAVAAGVALFEVALVPGIVIGAAAALAPRYAPGLRKGLRAMFNATGRRPVQPARAAPDRPLAEGSLVLPAGLHIQQAVAKTITFRVIVTTLDFTWNYLVIGELGAAAGLSGLSLVVGPVFYFVHETGWNHFGRLIERKAAASGPADSVPNCFSLLKNPKGPLARWSEFTISLALAKTITFRTFATTTDFATNYIVVGDVATAAALSAFGFVLGPFVYFGHERAWEYYGSRRGRAARGTTPLLGLPERSVPAVGQPRMGLSGG